ncbi:MAG: serine/threonine protein kinase [Solobacterium sp.]|nr:serine/threonine protein kinase [Solobacterium sp.]
MMNYEIGTVVMDGWKIIDKIGEGSYGRVFKVEKSKYGNLKDTAALKVIQIPPSQDVIKAQLAEGTDPATIRNSLKGYVDDMVKEVSILRDLKDHHNIVRYEDFDVIDHFTDGIVQWDILIRMELLTSLLDYKVSLASQNMRMETEDIVDLGIELSDALAYCAENNIIHRDIKPGNIFINKIGDYKLGDFGVARNAEGTAATMSMKGTESYMAPEVFLDTGTGHKYGANVDVYSLGLVMYELLNIRLPFMPAYPEPILNMAMEREKALMKRLSKEPLPKPLFCDDALAEIILKACAGNASDRYQSAQEFHDALEEYAASLQQSNEEIVTEPAEEDKTVGIFDVSEETIGAFSGFIQEEEQSQEDTTDKTFGTRFREIYDAEDKKEERLLPDASVILNQYIPSFPNRHKMFLYSLYPVIDPRQYTRCKNYIGMIPSQDEILACMVPNPMQTFTRIAFVFTKDAIYSNVGNICVKYKDIEKTKLFDLPHSSEKHVKIGLKDGTIIAYQMSRGHESLYDGTTFEKMIRALAGLNE